jgi:hypothetical protein
MNNNKAMPKKVASVLSAADKALGDFLSDHLSCYARDGPTPSAVE